MISRDTSISKEAISYFGGPNATKFSSYTMPKFSSYLRLNGHARMSAIDAKYPGGTYLPCIISCNNVAGALR